MLRMSRIGRTTKLDIINSALDKMGISGITAPAQASDYATLLDRLEGIMYEFENSRNICTRYNFTVEPDTADNHGMDFGLVEPVANMLTYRTLMDYEIPITPALNASVEAAVTSISNQTFQFRETQYPRRQPRGAGNTLRYNRWQRFYRKPDRVPLVCTSQKLDMGEIDDYSQSWADYLRDDEDISSFEIFHTTGIRLVTTGLSSPVVNYRVQGLNPSIDNGVEQVRIRITTSTGRIDERLLNFEVLPITNDPQRFSAQVT